MGSLSWRSKEDDYRKFASSQTRVSLKHKLSHSNLSVEKLAWSKDLHRMGRNDTKPKDSSQNSTLLPFGNHQGKDATIPCSSAHFENSKSSFYSSDRCAFGAFGPSCRQRFRYDSSWWDDRTVVDAKWGNALLKMSLCSFISSTAFLIWSCVFVDKTKTPECERQWNEHANWRGCLWFWHCDNENDSEVIIVRMPRTIHIWSCTRHPTNYQVGQPQE